ncbi:MAG TPA: sigma-70 family RNA polymerase sigma factor [Polyangia bacterium]|jgi:RNA polymerase sigma-70 factor (ECF subfamily)
MTYLRLATTKTQQQTNDDICLDAFQRELDYILRTLRQLGIRPFELDDLAQDMFVALRRSWSKYNPGRPLRPYLFGIAFRLASAYQRKRDREVPCGLVDVGDLNRGPDDTLLARQEQAIVRAALQRIPLARRTVFVMHDLHDMPAEEVVAALSIPLFTVYSRLRKARQEMRKAIHRLVKERDV